MSVAGRLVAWFRSYRGQPLSLVLRLAMLLSVAATVGMLLLLLGHILVRGVPALLECLP